VSTWLGRRPRQHEQPTHASQRVTKPDGRRARKYVYGKTRDEVHDKRVKLQAEAKRGPVATSTPTVAAYLAYWLREVVKPNLAPLTYATYETLTRVYIVPGIGVKRLDRLHVRDVQTWLNMVAQTCQCCAQGKDARRPVSRRRCCANRPVLRARAVEQHRQRPTQDPALRADTGHDRRGDRPECGESGEAADSA